MPKRVKLQKKPVAKPRVVRQGAQPGAPDAAAGREFVRTMRTELLSAVEAISGHTQMLCNDAAERPPEMRGDLEKLLQVAGELYDFIKQEITPGWADLDAAAFDERLRTVRHDVGNRLNHALGYCQFLIMEEREHFFGSLTADLETIQRCCRNCEAILLRYKRGAETSGESAAAVPETVRLQPAADVTPHCATITPPADIEPARILVVDDSVETCGLLTKFWSATGKKSRPPRRAARPGTFAASDFDLILLDHDARITGYEVLGRSSDERLRHRRSS